MRAPTVAALAGGGAAVLAAAFAFLAFPPAVATIPLVLGALLLPFAPGAALLGGAVAACSVRAVLWSTDPVLGATAALAVLLVSVGIAIRGAAAPAISGSIGVPVALAGLVVALVGLCDRVLDTTTFLAGPDVVGLAAVLGGLLAAAAVGAATTRFLSGRHAREAPLVMLAVGALAVGAALRLPHDAAPWIERAAALHGPDVSRTQFLAGSALLAWLVAGAAAVAVGGALGSASRSVRSPRRAAFGCACGVVIAAALPNLAATYPATAVGLAVACLIRPAALAALLAAATIAVGFVEAGRDRAAPIPRAAITADRVYVELGGPESPVADGASLPPAWPLDDGIAGIVRWLDAIAGPGTIALAPEAADTVSRLPPRPDRGWVAHDALRGRQASSVVAWLRPAGPTLDPHADRDATPVLRDSALVVEPLDLWRVTPDELAAWLAVRPDAFVVVFGRFAARVTGRATLDAIDRGPVLAFTPSSASVPTAPPHATDPTLRAEARTRLVPDLPRTGARALEHLLAHAPGLRTNDVPALLARARVELALAILRDDAVAEDHGFGLLEATDGAAIRALRAERARARDRLWIALARMRAADATDADIRFRFGTVLGRGNAPLAGVDELTRCIEFRPTLVDAFEELARAYLGAARRNEFKWTATGALDISYAVERLVVLMHPERVDEASQARMWTLLGRARRAKALRQSEVTARTPLLRDALGRFHRALELRPDDAEALLFQTLALLELEETAAAKASARSAVDAAPLDPHARAVRAAAMVAADRAAARDELRAAFRFGLAFPSSRSR